MTYSNELLGGDDGLFSMPLSPLYMFYRIQGRNYNG